MQVEGTQNVEALRAVQPLIFFQAVGVSLEKMYLKWYGHAHRIKKEVISLFVYDYHTFAYSCVLARFLGLFFLVKTLLLLGSFPFGLKCPSCVSTVVLEHCVLTALNGKAPTYPHQ